MGYRPGNSSGPVSSSQVSTAFAGVMAVLRRGQRSVTIGLVGDSTGDDRYVIGGVDTAEWPRVLITALGTAFPGYTVRERKWNDTAQGYDPSILLQTGTIDSGNERCAVFTSGTAGALQYGGVAVTTDLDVQMKIAPATYTPASDQTLAARWESANHSFLMLLKANGGLSLNWSTNGTTSAGEKVSTTTIPATANPGNGNPLWVRATLKLDNGASGNDVKFYYSTDGATWTQLGTTVTTAGVTTLFGGTGPYTIGAFTVGLLNPFIGKVLLVRIYPAIGGTRSVVPPLPDDWDYYSAETTVSFAGAPVLTLDNGSQAGQNVVYFDDSTRRTIVHQPHGQALVLVNTSHNDGTQSRAVWLAAYKTMLTNIQALLPYTPILCMGQNPTGLGGSFAITQQGIELRATRSAMVQQLAASMAGTYAFDAWPLLTAADTTDQLHPTPADGTGKTGAEKWAAGIVRQLVG